MLAGITRMPMREYLPWMVAGQVGYVVFFYHLGVAVTRWTDRLADVLSAHLWEGTAVSVAVVGLFQLVAFVRRRRACAAAQDVR